MSVQVYSSYAVVPTETQSGILGVKICAQNPSTRPIHIALVLDSLIR
jgi:hypothetical protein